MTATQVRVPCRIQHVRGNGNRLPTNTVFVGRSTRWANPYKGENGAATATRQMLSDDYRRWLTMPTRPDPRTGVQEFNNCPHLLGVPYYNRPTLTEIRDALAGRDLACTCPVGQPCHADVLLEIANAPSEPRP